MEGWCGCVFLMVRQTTLRDLPEIITLYHKFFKEGKLSGKPNPSSFKEGVVKLMDTGVALSLVEEGAVRGTMAGAIYDDFITGDVSCFEAFWYVDPDHRGMGGLKLFSRFEQEAKFRGAKRIWMIHLLALNSEKMERYYIKSGYELKEKVYVKELL